MDIEVCGAYVDVDPPIFGTSAEDVFTQWQQRQEL
jgi:hypothetical protein